MALPEHNNTREQKEAEEPRRAKSCRPRGKKETKSAHTHTHTNERTQTPRCTEMKETWARPKVQTEKATVARWAAATAAHTFSIFIFLFSIPEFLFNTLVA